MKKVGEGAERGGGARTFICIHIITVALST